MHDIINLVLSLHHHLILLLVLVNIISIYSCSKRAISVHLTAKLVVLELVDLPLLLPVHFLTPEILR